MPDGPVVLVIDDDPLVSVVVRRALEGLRHRLFTAGDGATGIAAVTERRPDVVILDNVLPDGLGLGALSEIHLLAPNVPILFVTARGTGGAAIEAMKLCAFDYLPKPLDPPKLRLQIERALALRTVTLERAKVAAGVEKAIWPPLPGPAIPSQPAGLIGDCSAMQTVFKSIGKVARQEIAVLISGEHGTGKESVAREIHAHSHRAMGPFVKVHCRGMSERRLDEELFGRVETPDDSGGGRAAEAASGTLVLQEIGAASLGLQAKLLSAVRDGYYESGDGHRRPFSCRLIAITTEDLEIKARAGEFRSDFYYTLSSFVIALPPVRQRHGDLRLLVECSVKKLQPIAAAFGVKDPHVSDEAMQALASHLWPGNIDELESVLKRALIEQKGNILLPNELLQAVSGQSAVPTAERPGASRYVTDWASFVDMRVEAGSDTLYADAIAETERNLFMRILRYTRGNQAQAARSLGITRASLRKKLRLHGMTAKPREE
ncbi:Nitrogen regulation protein NR(I) [Botrimarina colliarenosi]|uniref:Nitrogen regulation protein NR(I) n=1 Tax=Botrimarina colliarenosi TaxID=2528001 RepID=A0A5C6AC14_9BACT|nr:sigma-54 dependent transcriptional regulator [Botrimarina colliarenosi]TWT97572.1 Nitrogen regulation protein NR(I) [Botrimarina colliarenosi]